jgi:hypothetical protein
MLAGATFGSLLQTMRGMIDTGAWGLVVNVTLFVVVSFLTARTPQRSVAR